MQDDTEPRPPLIRDEEVARELDQPAEATALATDALNVLWRTRLCDLEPRTAVVLSPSTSVAEACARMLENRIGSVLVVDSGRLVGICTERDVLYKVACAGRLPATMSVAEVMTPNPTTLGSGQRLAQALNKMATDGCWHVPILDDDGQPTGVVSARQLVHFLVQQFPQELLNLPPDADQLTPQREGG